MRNINIKRKNGFSILAIILVIVAVIVAIGIWALSGSTNTDNTNNSVSDLTVSALINDTNSIQTAFDMATISGGQSPNEITYLPGVPSENNLLNGATGITSPIPNGKALRSDATEPEGVYVFTKTLYVNSNGAPEIAIMLGGVKDSVCKKINMQINNASSTDLIPTAGTMSYGYTFVQGATKANPNSTVIVDLHSNGITQDWTSGCIGGANPDNNLFYKVLKMN